MNRIHALTPENATGKTKELYEGIKGKLGRVPNVFTLMGNSPAVLEGYLKFSEALSTGVLDTKLRELIEIVDSDLTDFKTACFNDAEIAEILAAVGINIFTNYFNHITQPEVDFPKVK